MAAPTTISRRRQPGKKYRVGGKERSMKQWAAENGLTVPQFRRRFAKAILAGLDDNSAVEWAITPSAPSRTR